MWSGFVELWPDENFTQPQSKATIDVLLLEGNVVVYWDKESLCLTAETMKVCMPVPNNQWKLIGVKATPPLLQPQHSKYMKMPRNGINKCQVKYLAMYALLK